MSDLPRGETGGAGGQSDELSSALFAQLVVQQANMATMFLGKVPHPETGEVFKDIEAARLFIDQLAMLETKTKGNLTKQEAGLLKQTLMSLRLAFVEAIESPQPKPEAKEKHAEPPAAATAGAQAPSGGAEPQAATPAPEDHPKKFSKKY